MRCTFQIVVFFLFPLGIYSQDTLRNASDSTGKQAEVDTNHIEKLHNKTDSIRKPYFEAMTFSAGMVDGTAFPLRIHLEKRLSEKKLLTVGIWRTAFNSESENLFPKFTADFDIVNWWKRYDDPFPLSNWTLEVDFHKILVQQKFAASIYCGYGFELGNSWYLGGSVHLGFNASYAMTKRLRFTLGVGGRFMHLFANTNKYNKYERDIYYSPSAVSYANFGIKWVFKEGQKDTTRISKYFNALHPSGKLGIGIIWGMLINDYSLLDNDLKKNLGVKNKNYRPFGYPYIQFTKVTSKFHSHNVGFGYKKKSVFKYNRQSYTEQSESHHIYYQYDLPLFKTKKSNLILYTGLNCFANIKELKLGVGDRDDTSYQDHTLSYSSHSSTASVNLPLGYKKQFGSSGVWFDCGLNLNLINYEHINYSYEIIDVMGVGTGNSVITYTYENDRKDKFYTINPILHGIYFKIIFL